MLRSVVGTELYPLPPSLPPPPATTTSTISQSLPQDLHVKCTPFLKAPLDGAQFAHQLRVPLVAMQVRYHFLSLTQLLFCRQLQLPAFNNSITRSFILHSNHTVCRIAKGHLS